MARMAYADPSALSEETQKILERTPLNIFRMLVHAEPVARNFSRMGGALLGLTDFDPVLREMAIVRTGLLCGSSYEVHQHDRISRQVGMPEEKLQALRDGPDADVFNDDERLVLKVTDEIVRNVKASDETFKAVVERFGEQQAVELVITIGFYMMVSRFLENFEVDIEDGEVGPDISTLRERMEQD